MKTIQNYEAYNFKTLESYRLRKELIKAATLVGHKDSRTLHPTVINEIGKHIGTPKDIIASAAISSLYLRSLRTSDEPTNSRRMV